VPKVSIVAATYNHEKFIVEAIESIKAQTFQDWELIIVDDCSTDGTLELAKSFCDSKIRVISNNSNLGLGFTTNAGFAVAQGSYVAWIATDDVFEAEYLQLFVEALDQSPDCVAVFGKSLLIDEDGRSLERYFGDESASQTRYQKLRTLFFGSNTYCSPGVMFRRSVLERLGCFNPRLRQLQDMEMWVRSLFIGDFKVLPNVIVRQRIRGNLENMSSPSVENQRRCRFELLQMMDEYSKNIRSFELLLNVFPELESDLPSGVSDVSLIPYFLATMILRIGELQSYHRLWALTQLYRMFENPDTSALLQQHFQFSYPQLSKLVGAEAVFVEDADSRMLELMGAVSSLKTQIASYSNEDKKTPSLLQRAKNKVRTILKSVSKV
jgi:glycosyltransferase involved in cell wall biosynthesis